MKISNELQKKLKTLCDGKTKIIITGFNDLGQPFETKGKITRDDKGDISVLEDRIYLEFGKEKFNEKTPYTKWVAPYVTNYEEDGFEGTTLIIKTIKLENGEVLFENEDADKYLDKIIIKYKQYEKELEDMGCFVGGNSPVSKELLNYLGKPITIVEFENHHGKPTTVDSLECVLSSLPETYDDGFSRIKVRDSVLVGSIGIHSDAALLAVNLDTGEEEFVCANQDGWLQSYERLTGRKLKQKEKNEQVNEANQPGNE